MRSALISTLHSTPTSNYCHHRTNKYKTIQAEKHQKAEDDQKMEAAPRFDIHYGRLIRYIRINKSEIRHQLHPI
jgi:hypothetical protein